MNCSGAAITDDSISGWHTNKSCTTAVAKQTAEVAVTDCRAWHGNNGDLWWDQVAVPLPVVNYILTSTWDLWGETVAKKEQKKLCGLENKRVFDSALWYTAKRLKHHCCFDVGAQAPESPSLHCRHNRGSDGWPGLLPPNILWQVNSKHPCEWITPWSSSCPASILTLRPASTTEVCCGIRITLPS